jgi:hypothetical protein
VLTAHLVTDATNASPIVVTTADAHELLSGDRAFLQGITGNTAANGSFYVNVTGPDTAELFSNAALTVPVAGSGVWTDAGQGTIQYQYTGLGVDQDKGNELYCIAGLGAGTFYKIKSNTSTKIYIDGDWIVTPDATSVFVVNNFSWNFSVHAEGLSNASNTTSVQLEMNIPNYSGKLVFLQGFTQDGESNESPRGLCPYRIVYVFGKTSVSSSELVLASRSN